MSKMKKYVSLLLAIVLLTSMLPVSAETIVRSPSADSIVVPAKPTISIRVTPDQVRLEENVTLAADVTGEAGPYAVAWQRYDGEDENGQPIWTPVGEGTTLPLTMTADVADNVYRAAVSDVNGNVTHSSTVDMAAHLLAEQANALPPAANAPLLGAGAPEMQPAAEELMTYTVTVEASSDKITEGDPEVYFFATVVNANGQPLEGGEVYFYVNGVQYGGAAYHAGKGHYNDDRYLTILDRITPPAISLQAKLVLADGRTFASDLVTVPVKPAPVNMNGYVTLRDGPNGQYSGLYSEVYYLSVTLDETFAKEHGFTLDRLKLELTKDNAPISAENVYGSVEGTDYTRTYYVNLPGEYTLSAKVAEADAEKYSLDQSTSLTITQRYLEMKGKPLTVTVGTDVDSLDPGIEIVSKLPSVFTSNQEVTHTATLGALTYVFSKVDTTTPGAYSYSAKASDIKVLAHISSHNGIVTEDVTAYFFPWVSEGNIFVEKPETTYHVQLFGNMRAVFLKDSFSPSVIVEDAEGKAIGKGMVSLYLNGQAVDAASYSSSWESFYFSDLWSAMYRAGLKPGANTLSAKYSQTEEKDFWSEEVTLDVQPLAIENALGSSDAPVRIGWTTAPDAQSDWARLAISQDTYSSNDWEGSPTCRTCSA